MAIPIIFAKIAPTKTMVSSRTGSPGERMKRESGASPEQSRCRKLHSDSPHTLHSTVATRRWEGGERREQAGRPATVIE